VAAAHEAAARPRSNGPREAAQHGKPTKPDDNRRLSAASALPGKTTLLGKSDTLPGKSHFSERDDLPGKIRQRQSIGLPDKIRQEATERRGWIEYAKRGTKNPKRYAYRRRWKKIGGKWIKAESKRLKSIPPLTEEEYVRRITGEGRNPTTGRKRRDRAD
jgi:hypothetical protein